MMKTKIVALVMLCMMAMSLMGGIPVLATEQTNLIPGGSFAEEVFAEGASENSYNSGETFNNGTWTAGFTYNEVANDSGYVRVRKLSTGGNQVELRRGGSGSGYMTSKAFTLLRGKKYIFSHTFRCTSSNGTDATVTIEEYKDASCTEIAKVHTLYKGTLGNVMTNFADSFTVSEGVSKYAYVFIRFNIGNSRRALQIQDINLTLDASVSDSTFTGNVLPGGAFEEEAFAEGETVKSYDSGTKINNGTWTCSYGVDGYCKVTKYNDGMHMVELKRSTSGAATLASPSLPVRLGKTYKVSYDIRCTSSSGVSYTLSAAALQSGTTVTTHTLYTSPSPNTSSSIALKNTFKHMEHYFTVPTGRSSITDINLSFSIGGTSRALQIRNISFSYCDAPLTGFTAAAPVEQDIYNSLQWCKNDGYGSLNVHTIVSKAYIPSAMKAGSAVTLYPTAADVSVEGEASRQVLLAQYSKDDTLLEVKLLTTETAQAAERDYLRKIKSDAVTLRENAVKYKLFYLESLSTLIPMKGITGGSISA